MTLFRAAGAALRRFDLACPARRPGARVASRRRRSPASWICSCPTLDPAQRQMLMIGLGVCVLGMLFGLVMFNQVKAMPAHKAMLDVSHDHLRDVQGLPAQAGPAARWCSRSSSAPASSTTSASCSTWTPMRVVDDPRVLGARHPRLLRRGVVRHPHEHVREQPHGVRLAQGQAAARSTRSRSRPA